MVSVDLETFKTYNTRSNVIKCFKNQKLTVKKCYLYFDCSIKLKTCISEEER